MGAQGDTEEQGELKGVWNTTRLEGREQAGGRGGSRARPGFKVFPWPWEASGGTEAGEGGE